MKLYHGSNVEVKEPRLIPSKRLLDFGMGFYLTSDYQQAKKWAIRTANNRNTGEPIVSVFEVDLKELEQLNILTFTEANKEWLRYISANRTGKIVEENYDLVIGPVANDQVIRTVNDYIIGYLPEAIAIELLLPQKLKDQYAFRTEKAIAVLNFLEGKRI
jgi:hypothetical protein